MARVANFADRLNEAMRIRGKKAVEISRETGIDNASISYWRHGKYEATQTGVYLLSKCLDVNEAWLMGYDVPMERQIKKASPPEPSLTEGEQLLLDLFRRVPEDKQELVLGMIRAALGSSK
jgi:transcriptional regulator with XRE-family HTH domain